MQTNLFYKLFLTTLGTYTFSAYAAVYQVVEITDNSDVTSLAYYNKSTTDVVEFYSQAIEASEDGISCFSSDCGEADNYTVVGESRFGSDGDNYRDAMRYLMDNSQYINDLSSLESYCSSYIGFNTCDSWANQQYYGTGYNTYDVTDGSGYGGLQRVQAAWDNGYYANTFPLLDGIRVNTFANDANSYSVDDIEQTLGAIENNSWYLSANAVVNGLTSFNGTDYVFGNTSSSFFVKDSRFARQFTKRGFVNIGTEIDSSSYELPPPETSEALVTLMGQTLASDAVEYNEQLLIVGSASYSPSSLDDSDKLPNSDYINIGTNFSSSTFADCAETADDAETLLNTWECQFSTFANDAYYWTVDSNGTVSNALSISASELDVLDPDNNDRSVQAEAKAVAIIDGNPVIVGYSTEYEDDDYYAIRAVLFDSNNSGLTENGWTMSFIPDTDVEDNDGNRQYTYSVATAINSNGLVLGVAKYSNAVDRSYAESIFIYDYYTSQTTFVDSSIDADIFFSGYNAFPSAINNNDQLVGWIDSETVNQVEGRERRQRAFTYLVNDVIADSPLTAGGAWMLDDLTNGGDYSDANNQFRIARATDINDAGIISATAFKCENGYSDYSSEATCEEDERVVAVKLVPIVGGTIDERDEVTETITRSGASLNGLALFILSLISLRKRMARAHSALSVSSD
ncbi:DUF3466 family protein [Photobacterium sp. OFAV2-7]|uniref:DUF3466 family protein n=1 Tax=Photobacterium sp. OFAV2-7 TaxID=2917748 RepID=UPI001EF589BD|nr:DUF3466 family protein [Photobacterium sp. OFAV2-7]MCG7588449.1 DUF3466 family protein [Photobacterium sp. OFAV2-7]